METTKPISILMADDDIEDQMLVREAFMEARLANDLAIVSDGEQLLDYLHKRGEYTECTRPHIILLDLNMPHKNGREALAEIKSDPLLKQIPIIVLTSSSTDEDIVASYDLGVSSYILKPVTFENLVDLVKELGHYWLEIVELPPDI